MCGTIVIDSKFQPGLITCFYIPNKHTDLYFSPKHNKQEHNKIVCFVSAQVVSFDTFTFISHRVSSSISPSLSIGLQKGFSDFLFCLVLDLFPVSCKQLLKTTFSTSKHYKSFRGALKEI